MNLASIKILLVDDEPANRMLIGRFLTKIGHHVIAADSGKAAIQLFNAEPPDVVILDVMMPDMNGYEVVRQIKELSKARWIPVIMTSGLSSPADQIIGLYAGADDYLVKPIDLSILAYKIQAMQRIAVIQNTLFDTLQVLKLYQDKTEEEIGLARHMMQRLTRSDELEAQGITYFNMPAGAFSGDVVSAVRGQNGLQYVLMADVTGHGLSSALNAIPLIEAFLEFADRGSSLGELCRGINSRLKFILPAGYFVAAMVVAIDHQHRTIQIWNGGLPTAVFLDTSGEICCEWRSRHLALGILNDGEFDTSTEFMSWDKSGQVIMYTDGLIEARSATGEPFGEARVTEIFCEAPEDERMVQLGLNLTAFLSGTAPHDDITLVSIDCR